MYDCLPFFSVVERCNNNNRLFVIIIKEKRCQGLQRESRYRLLTPVCLLLLLDNRPGNFKKKKRQSTKFEIARVFLFLCVECFHVCGGLYVTCKQICYIPPSIASVSLLCNNVFCFLMSNVKQNAEFAVQTFFLPPMIQNICIIKHTRQKLGATSRRVTFLLHVIMYITLGVDQNQGGCRENKEGGAGEYTRDMCVPHWFVDVVLLFTGFSTHNTLSSTTHFLKNVPFKKRRSLEILAYICSTTPGDRGVRYYYCINLS